MSDLTRPTTPRSDSWQRDFPSAVDLTSDYDRGIEAMRAACIKAVEADLKARITRDVCEGDTDGLVVGMEYALSKAIVALREVQP